MHDDQLTWFTARADGWLGIWVSANRYGQVVAQMTEIAGEAGRVGVEWRNGLNMWCGTGPTREAARGPVAEAMHKAAIGEPGT